MRIERSRIWLVGAVGLTTLLLLTPSALKGKDQPTVEELKARLTNTKNVADRPVLCLHISERQVEAAERFYLAGDQEKAQAALADVTAFAKLDRDYAIQSHKH
jgi:hypothetical protein